MVNVPRNDEQSPESEKSPNPEGTSSSTNPDVKAIEASLTRAIAERSVFAEDFSGSWRALSDEDKKKVVAFLEEKIDAARQARTDYVIRWEVNENLAGRKTTEPEKRDFLANDPGLLKLEEQLRRAVALRPLVRTEKLKDAA